MRVAPLFLSSLLLGFATGCVGNLGGEMATGGGDGTPAALDDGVDPIVHLEAPAPASILPGTAIRFTGRIEDAHPSHVMIGDARLDADASGRFDGTVEVAPGAHRIHVVGFDDSGREGRATTSALVGELADPGTPVIDAVALAATDEVLADIGRGIGAMLTEQSFDSQLRSQNPVFDEWYAEVDLEGESHGQVQVALEPGDGTLTATVYVMNLRVDIDVDLPVGSASAEIRAGYVEVGATLNLGAEGGDIVGSVQSSSVHLRDFSFDINNFPGAIEQIDSIREAARRKVEEALDSAIADALPGLVADALASVPEGTTVAVNGAEVSISARMEELILNPMGVRARADLAFSAVAPLPERTAIGYLVQPRGAMLPHHDAPLSIDFAFDALNALLSEAWAGGALDLVLASTDLEGALGSSLSVGTVRLLIPGVGGAIPGDTPVAVELSLALPPVLTPAADRGLRLDLADVRVVLVAEAVDGASMPLVELSVGLGVTVSPSLAGGAVALELGALDVDVTFVGDAPSGADAESLTTLVSDLMDTHAADLLPEGGLAVPTLYGFDLNPTAITTDGGYLGLEATPSFSGP